LPDTILLQGYWHFGKISSLLLNCLHVQKANNKPVQKHNGFLEGWIFQPIRAFQITLIGWIKADPPKRPLLL